MSMKEPPSIASSLDRIADLLDQLTLHAGALVEQRDREPAPLPSRYATVHAMGNSAYTGEVEVLERGAYRIRYLDGDLERQDIGDLETAYAQRTSGKCAVKRVKDIRAVHSVDWLDEAEHQKHVEFVESKAIRHIESVES